jgi:subtilisin family serine protease
MFDVTSDCDGRGAVGGAAPGDHIPGRQATGAIQACGGRGWAGAAERGARTATGSRDARRLATSAEALAGHLDTARNQPQLHHVPCGACSTFELKATEQRALQSRLRLAGLPFQMTLEEFD